VAETPIATRPATIERLGGDAARKRAASEVKTGQLFDLGRELSMQMPLGSPDVFGGFRIWQHRTPRCLVEADDPPPYDFSMDVISGSPHLGTHIDAPIHIQAEGRVFGGYRAVELFGDFGWSANGIDEVSPIFVRGILLDVARAVGVEQLADGFEITPKHLDQCLASQGVLLEPGTAVLVRTGKIAEWARGDNHYFTAQPGVGVDAALWLYEKGMAILGTDTSATEPIPLQNPARTVHRAMLVERGLLLLEILDLEELAAARTYEFLFVCLPLKIVGATGSWVRPIAVC
jgi:kynurenine formamidase